MFPRHRWLWCGVALLCASPSLCARTETFDSAHSRFGFELRTRWGMKLEGVFPRHEGEVKQKHAPVGYADINAVLFDSIQARRSDPALASSPEVELSIVRILESLRLGRAISWQEAAGLLRGQKLDAYLAGYDS